MKKVGIMTWFSYINFGTVLQVYALQNVLLKNGVQAKVINYVPAKRKKSIFRTVYYIKTICNLILSQGYYKEKEREHKFNNFIKNNLLLTSLCDSMDKLKDIGLKFDKYVCGSDQIWSPDNFNAHYFLDFVMERERKIAYAPSFGVSKIENKKIERIIKMLISDFSAVSVREKSGADIVEQLTGRIPKVVLDPTILLDENEWNDLLNLSNHQKDKKYVLCYFLGNRKQNWELVKAIVTKENKLTKVIPVYNSDKKHGYEVQVGVGPKEFVDLIRNADLVLTDSFHGMMFSIIYKKNFYMFERFLSKDKHNQNSRIYNVLDMLNLESQLIKMEEDLIKTQKINYEEVISILELRKKESLNYLLDAIEKE